MNLALDANTAQFVIVTIGLVYITKSIVRIIEIVRGVK